MVSGGGGQQAEVEQFMREGGQGRRRAGWVQILTTIIRFGFISNVSGIYDYILDKYQSR